MNTIGYLAIKSKVEIRLISAACKKMGIEPTIMQNEHNIINEIENLHPSIIFIEEIMLQESHSFIIDEIKRIKSIEEAFIIFASTSSDLSKVALKLGADAFLPIPFSFVKFESLLRNVIGLPRKILLVSKSEETVADLKTVLLKIGYEVFWTDSGDDCMKKSHSIFPDLVLTDYFLFDMTGIELSKKIKNANLSVHIPVMILFKGNSADIIAECFEAGCQDVLLYPLDDHTNIDRITTVVTPPKKGRKERALVIDDSPMIRGLIARMLKQQGYIVYSAENGLEGLKVARKIKPDIITCDYDMPVMNGWDFCLEARQDKEVHAPIIMVTARGTDIDKKKGGVLGVTEYLTKPFKEDDLKKIVAKTIADNKRKIERDAITKYIAKDALVNVADVIEGIKNREPEDKEITLFFSDICSFTTKCERLSPKAVVKLLNSYFENMIKIALKHNAVIDKMIGDALVIRFDCGNSRQDAHNAVLTACEMLKSLQELNQDAFEPIEIRIGINTGHVILGNIGSESFRLDYTMIGDNVNIGQRLESQSAHMGCLISESTYLLINDLVEVGESRELSLKGKQQTVKAYPLLSVKHCTPEETQ